MATDVASSASNLTTDLETAKRGLNNGGISRELYALIGPSAPSIVAHLHKPNGKGKVHDLTAGTTKWEWQSFKNSARTDSLQLGHWVKARSNTDADYPFAKYNVHPTDYMYTPDEYSRTLEDSEWTKEETDYLFSIVKQYDQRWYVIYDRYEYSSGRDRSLEDLKERFCNVCRRLVKDRPWTGDPSAKSAVVASFTFDKERELIRKRYLANLESRTPREVEEEEALYLEIKRIEQNERKFKRDREELLRTLAGIESGLPDIVEDELPAILFDNKKKRKNGMDLDSPSTPVPQSATLSAPPPKRVPVNPKIPPPDPVQCISHIELSLTTPATKAAHQPSYLRTFKLPNPKPNILPKVTQTLSDIGVYYNRLVMPTEGNVAKLNALVDSTVQFIEVRKVLDKIEGDIRALKQKLGLSENAVVELDAGDSDIMGEDGGVDSMGRAQSVASVRSGRGRKQRGRSLSTSSVDTSVSRAHKRTRRG